MSRGEVVIADQRERALARDPARSVIVQAPAGSGKTELLMQRYLALLAVVDEPEHILAVTFTRKAAAEMRHRILQALRPAEPDQRLAETAALAEAVLARNEERGWQLLDYPARLRIRTLDSVNSWLTASAPVSSGDRTSLGVVTERPGELYELAARQVLELLADDSELSRDVAVLLRHLDNQADRFVYLAAQMLQRRDQWLPLIGTGELGPHARGMLEESLADLLRQSLEQVGAMLSPPLRAELTELLSFAAGHLRGSEPASPVLVWVGAEDFPPADPEAIAHWRSLADFCLTKSDPQFRKSVDKRNGFPTARQGGDDAMKRRAKALLDSLQDDTQLAAALHRLRNLPEPRYSDAQWEALAALFRVLPVVAAQLTLVFREQGATDYIQVAGEALEALGAEGEPTGLALRLDYQVQHILIDEFQDTSRTQYRLLGRLTDGWTGDDGRTLFVVGDPMQSIYRFRQAEVALYLQMWAHGIGNLHLEQVRLSSNFRSDPALVGWVNETFAQLMPPENDPATGAVQFAPGVAVRDGRPGAQVVPHAYEQPGRVDEARDIGAIVQQALADAPNESIGILVRTRHQARLIVRELRARGIAFSGEGLEQAGETQVEQDLLTLTRALTHLADRTAWLAMLRAPWCGLSLADLEAVCGSDWQQPVIEQLRMSGEVADLSADGRARIAHLLARLDPILSHKGSLPLRDWIEGAWQQLGGPAALSDPRDLDLAIQFFAMLDECEEGGDAVDAFLLHERLPERKDRPAGDELRVHLLTLFRAKGLEYDTVILPALDGTTRQDDKTAIAWHEYAGSDEGARYLMAPIEATGDDSDPLQQLIREFDREQAGFERDRLLYVAATRARHKLHVFFELKRNKDGEICTPTKGSLLERLWPVLAEKYAAFSGPAGTEEAREQWVQPLIRRFPADFVVQVAPPAVQLQAAAAPAEEDPREVTYDWAGTDAMRIGLVVHRCLQFIVERQHHDWADAAVVRALLAEAGVAAVNLAQAAERVLQALADARADERGRWLLARHEDDLCEFPLSVFEDGAVRRRVVDRSFVEAGVRWIVDYKSSVHEGGNLDAFLASEVERYRGQLGEYRAALMLLEPGREIRTALYFPLLRAFREIEWGG